MPDESILGKIQKLLAKAESTTHAEEADAFFAKAQEMMAKHAIDEAMLISRGEADLGDPVIVYATVSKPHPLPKITLLHNVAKNNRCKVIKTGPTQAAIIGLPKDVEFVQLLFSSLLMQATSMVLRTEIPSYENTGSYRKSLLYGFATGVDEKFKTLKVKMDRDFVKTPGVALVLVDQSKLVKDAVKEIFPHTTSTSINIGSSGGYASGAVAGRNADVSGGRNTVSSGVKGAIG